MSKFGVSLLVVIAVALVPLYAGAADDFAAYIEAWPADVRQVLEEMTAEAF